MKPEPQPQQEWTPEFVMLVREGCEASGLDFDTKISDAHNADVSNLKQQLAAEQKRYMELDNHCCNLRHELIKAQAAIAELRVIANARYCGHCDLGHEQDECTCGNYEKIGDTSALDKHDEGVRKPLVDALEKARHRFEKTGWPEAAKDCADALAKVSRDAKTDRASTYPLPDGRTK